jgi:hypothetical protein
LDAGKLGKFNLPVTITPTSNTIFFIDPTNGNDASPGTAAQPWKFVENVLDSAQPPGLKVATVANAGNDVVVTILGGTNNETVTNNITTPALSVGSVTVLQAPFPKTFKLIMGANKLILNKGYKLQDIKITSTIGSGIAVLIKHPTAGLASVDVKCTGSSVKCVEVTGPGLHTLKDVRVDVAANSSNVGILNNANLSIVGGEVRLTGSGAGITLIDSQGVLTVTDLTVDMTDGGVHMQNSTGIFLNAAGSFVTGSTIKVSNNASAIGIDVQGGANLSIVEGNTFIGPGTGIGVNGGNNLSSGVPGALLKNNFSGLASKVLP